MSERMEQKAGRIERSSEIPINAARPRHNMSYVTHTDVMTRHETHTDITERKGRVALQAGMSKNTLEN